MLYSLCNIWKYDKIKIVIVICFFLDVFFLGGGLKLYFNYFNECFIKCFKNLGNYFKGGCMVKRVWRVLFWLVY